MQGKCILRTFEAEWRGTADPIAANNFTVVLVVLQRFKIVKALLRKTLPVARRVLDGG